MTLFLGIALGGVFFSLCGSCFAAVRETRRPRTPHEAWLAEIRKINVILDRA